MIHLAEFFLFLATGAAPNTPSGRRLKRIVKTYAHEETRRLRMAGEPVGLVSLLDWPERD